MVVSATQFPLRNRYSESKSGKTIEERDDSDAAQQQERDMRLERPEERQACVVEKDPRSIELGCGSCAHKEGALSTNGRNA
jgi:hypothetical protein